MVGLKRRMSCVFSDGPATKKSFRQSLLPDSLSRLLSTEPPARHPEVSRPSLIPAESYASLTGQDISAGWKTADRQLQVRSLHLDSLRDLAKPRNLYLIEPDLTLSSETLSSETLSSEMMNRRSAGSRQRFVGSAGTRVGTEGLCTDSEWAAPKSAPRKRALHDLTPDSFEAVLAPISADSGQIGAGYEAISEAEMFRIDAKRLRSLRREQSRFKRFKVW